VVLPEVAIILEEQIMGLSVVDGIGLDHVDPSVAQRDVQTMASFHGVHSRQENQNLGSPCLTK
jgi:hypothetical protein